MNVKHVDISMMKVSEISKKESFLVLHLMKLRNLDVHNVERIKSILLLMLRHCQVSKLKMNYSSDDDDDSVDNE